ncbi:hypothetical protein [Micromonospora sp. KLBMP9576]|uniref:hypothetical protein n=1 Tax=Micromonospora sp. KLBMP9576 TaxID=3424769 RepID=UPI003D8ADF95
MRTVSNGRLTRLLVPGALLFMALGSPAVAGSTADDSVTRTVAGSALGLSHVAPAPLLKAPPNECTDQSRVPQLWDNLFPACNR